jgi:phosphopantothenate-cysteine ligase/phosphopantothenoylcysteine decarboxylase/phosphopantothenate--cysteine ligase
MRILVTAGNTQTPIDAVRCITNIFTGRTGTRIALEAARRGHQVVLLSSHPEVVGQFAAEFGFGEKGPANLAVRVYRTFDDLHRLLADALSQPQGERFDVVIHAAAVSDYAVAGVYAAEAHPTPEALGLPGPDPIRSPRLVPVAGGKISSGHAELWLRLVPTPKLVDLFRSPWGFSGILVKFKLEVGISEAELQQRAEASRLQSGADLMVANTLEGMYSWALVGPVHGCYEQVERAALAKRLLDLNGERGT